MSAVSPLIRAAIFVSDLEKSAEFYKNVLQLEEVFFAGSLDADVVNDLLGMPDTSSTRAIILKQAGPNFGMVGLFEVTGPSPPRKGTTGSGCHVGEVCMVFYCSDLQEICEKLARYGGEIVSAPKLLKIDAIPGQGHLEMTFRGPDDELINAIERDPHDLF